MAREPRCATYDYDAGHSCTTPPVVALDYWFGGRRLGAPFATDYACMRHAAFWADCLAGGCLRVVVRWRWLTTVIVEPTSDHLWERFEAHRGRCFQCASNYIGRCWTGRRLWDRYCDNEARLLHMRTRDELPEVARG